MLEFPDLAGQRVPMSGRPEHLDLIKAHKQTCLQYLYSDMSDDEVKRVGERDLTHSHKDMAPESENAFHNQQDWKWRTSAPIIFLAGRLNGVSSAADLDINLNRCVVGFRKPVKKRPPKTVQGEQFFAPLLSCFLNTD